MTPLDSSEHLSTAIIMQIASREVKDPSDLKESLYESIDPDALDALFH